MNLREKTILVLFLTAALLYSPLATTRGVVSPAPQSPLPGRDGPQGKAYPGQHEAIVGEAPVA